MLYLFFLILVSIYLLPIKSKKTSLVIVSLLMLLLTIFRFGIGSDYFSYKSVYDGMRTLRVTDLFGYYSNIDLGFKAIMFFFSSFGLNYHIFNSLISSFILIMLLMWLYSITENHKDFLVSAILLYSMFIFVWSWSALRQGLVLSILAMSLYNPKVNISKKSKIIIIIGCSLLHSSALIMLLFMFDFKVSKKNVIIYCIIGMLISLLPLKFLLDKMSFIPFLSSFSKYLSSDPSLLKFSSIVRISILSISLLYNDYLTEDNKYYSEMMDYFFKGFILYFFTSMSPIAAGRLHIYTYILVIPLIAKIWQDKRYSKIYQFCIMSAIILFSTMYLFKEANTMKIQTGIITDHKFMPYSNIFDKSAFDTYFYQLSNQVEVSLERFDSFFLDKEIEFVKPKESDRFISVYSEEHGYYGIMNQNGQIVSDFYSSTPIEIYGSYYRKISYSNGIKNAEIYNLITGELANFDDISPFVTYKKYVELQPVKSDLAGLSLVDESVSDLFIFPEKVGKIYLTSFKEPFSYSLFNFKYYERNYVIYLNESNEPIIDMYFDAPGTIDEQGFIIGYSAKTKEIYNENGVLVWIERR